MDNCIFCKIANGEIPSATLYEDEDFRVILDLGPATKGHALILPKQHFANLFELSDEVSEKVLKVAKKVGGALVEGLGAEGMNLIQNNGEVAGQTVMHVHFHLIPRYTKGPQVPLWKPGKLTDEDAKSIVENVKSKM